MAFIVLGVVSWERWTVRKACLVQSHSLWKNVGTGKNSVTLGRVILITHSLQKLSISFWRRYKISSKTYKSVSGFEEAGLEQHCLTGCSFICRLDNSCSQHSGKNTLIAQRINNVSVHAATILISVPFLHLKLSQTYLVLSSYFPSPLRHIFRMYPRCVSYYAPT